MICVISSEERGRLIHYKLAPVCTQHKHCSFGMALKRIASGLWEVVTDISGKQYLMETPMYFLAVKKSGNIGVVQRVKKAQPVHIEKIEFGLDETAPSKKLIPRGLSIADIEARETRFRTEQLEQQGSAIRANFICERKPRRC